MINDILKVCQALYKQRSELLATNEEARGLVGVIEQVQNILEHTGDTELTAAFKSELIHLKNKVEEANDHVKKYLAYGTFKRAIKKGKYADRFKASAKKIATQLQVGTLRGILNIQDGVQDIKVGVNRVEEKLDSAKRRALSAAERQKAMQDQINSMHGKQRGGQHPKEYARPLQMIEESEISWDRDRSGKRVVLGEGGFGTVLKGTWQGIAVAIKVLNITRKNKQEESAFKEELELLMQLTAPTIIRPYGGVYNAHRLGIVMDYMPGGSLFDRLRSKPSLAWQQKYIIALDTAYALDFLHKRDILHRDLKSLNILLDATGKAKLCDFGFAKVKSASNSKLTTISQGNKGTTQWMAPELFGIGAVTYSIFSDIYAYAMVLFELLTHEMPFEQILKGRDPSFLLAWVPQGKRPNLPSDGPENFKAMINRGWSQEASSRGDAQSFIAPLRGLIAASNSDLGRGNQSGGSSCASSASSESSSGSNWQGSSSYSTASVSSNAPTPPRPPAPAPISAPAPAPAFFQARVVLDPRSVTQFLQHVVNGDEVSVLGMLDSNPRLLLGVGDITDSGKRTFTGITGLQYALWACDEWMWRRIEPYFEGFADEKRLQAARQEAVTIASGYGDHYDMSPLTAGYKHWLAATVVACDKIWISEVGAAQSTLVSHMIHEYCHPTRNFADGAQVDMTDSQYAPGWRNESHDTSYSNGARGRPVWMSVDFFDSAISRGTLRAPRHVTTMCPYRQRAEIKIDSKATEVIFRHRLQARQTFHQTMARLPSPGN